MDLTTNKIKLESTKKEEQRHISHIKVLRKYKQNITQHAKERNMSFVMP